MEEIRLCTLLWQLIVLSQRAPDAGTAIHDLQKMGVQFVPGLHSFSSDTATN